MANLIQENFTGSNDTVINGYNSWVASSNGLKIKSNKAAKTDNGLVYAYKSASGWTGARSATVKHSRYEGIGQRYFNYLVVGSSDVSNITNFLNNSIYVASGRSGQAYNNTLIQVYDGTTQVASNTSPGWQFTGQEITLTLTINANGSGTAVMTDGTNSTTLSWGARTWTKGVGNYHGFYADHSGNDGQGQLTRSQFDSFSLDTVDTITNYNASFLNIMRRV
jgi:hypothetical protein